MQDTKFKFNDKTQVNTRWLNSREESRANDEQESIYSAFNFTNLGARHFSTNKGAVKVLKHLDPPRTAVDKAKEKPLAAQYLAD